MTSNRTQYILRLAERDYLYGAGELKLRVARIDRANPVEYDGELWFHVEGVQLGWADVELGPRQVVVRAQRLTRDNPVAR